MHESTTHGRVHAGLGGFQRLVARKKSWCTLGKLSPRNPHQTLAVIVMDNPDR